MIYRVSLNSPNLFAVIIAITVVQLMAKEACQLRLGPSRRSSRLVETGGRGGTADEWNLPKMWNQQHKCQHGGAKQKAQCSGDIAANLNMKNISYFLCHPNMCMWKNSVSQKDAARCRWPHRTLTLSLLSGRFNHKRKSERRTTQLPPPRHLHQPCHYLPTTCSQLPATPCKLSLSVSLSHTECVHHTHSLSLVHTSCCHMQRNAAYT